MASNKSKLYNIQLDGEPIPENYKHVVTDLSHKDHLHGPLITTDNEKYKPDSNSPFSSYAIEDDSPSFYSLKRQYKDFHTDVEHNILDAIEVARMDIKGAKNMSITQDNTITNDHITEVENRLTLLINNFWNDVKAAFATLTNKISTWVQEIKDKIQNHTVIVTDR